MGGCPLHVMFFDAAGTLFHVKGSVGEAYLSHARKYGVTCPVDVLEQAFARAFADAPPPTFAATDPQEIKACERMWWFDVVHNVFYRVGMFPGFDDYFEEVFEYFARPEAWVPYPETLEVLLSLEARGIELGIVSNFDSRLYGILLGLGLDRFFESITLSSFAGAAKPSPKIFERALRKHGRTPTEVLHVGDSLTGDFEGATAAGLRAVWLDRTATGSSPSLLRIGSLKELLPLVEHG